MKHLILIRHGQSEWNQQKRFTGWVDVGLTDKGRAEAKKAGELIKEKKIKLDSFYSSYQKRANDTLKIVMKELNEDENLIIKKWQLNERHYGELTGLNKEDMKKKYGEEKIHQFRRSWDVKPGALDRKSPFHPLNIETYKDIPVSDIPDTESLKDTHKRVVDCYNELILKDLQNGKGVCISAHGNSLRALCKYLFKINEREISKMEIPTANPLLIIFEDKLQISSVTYLDQERAKNLVAF